MGSWTYAQTGITIGPPRVYFTMNPGESQTETIIVSNSSKDYTLDLGVSFEDWEYNETGDNVLHPAGTLPTSLAAWLTVEEPLFSLAPGERKELNIQLSIPPSIDQDSIPVRTAMLFVTQLNPRAGVNEDGANIQIAVRSGIKLYQRSNSHQIPQIEITNFTKHSSETQNYLVLHFENNGKIWADGRISLELLNQGDGSKRTLPVTEFFSMPGDRRQHALFLPADLAAGTYLATAIVNYGDLSTVKIAELEFTHE